MNGLTWTSPESLALVSGWFSEARVEQRIVPVPCSLRWRSATIITSKDHQPSPRRQVTPAGRQGDHVVGGWEDYYLIILTSLFGGMGSTLAPGRIAQAGGVATRCIDTKVSASLEGTVDCCSESVWLANSSSTHKSTK